MKKLLEKNDSLTFIINRTDAIGDLVLTLPVAKKLKDNFPNCSVVMIVSSRNKEVVDHCPYVDGFVEFSGGFLKTLSNFKKVIDGNANTVFIHFGGSQIPILQSYMLGVKFRFGLKK